MRSSIKTNPRVLVSNSREAASFESYTFCTRFIFVFIPNFLSQVSWNSRISISFKERLEVVETFSSIVYFKIINNWSWFWSFWSFCFSFSFNFNWSFNRSWYFFFNRLWFSFSCWLSCSSWCSYWLLHLWRLWFKSSSLSFLFLNNSGRLELRKVTTLIEWFSHIFAFSSTLFWMRPASRKTLGKE